MLQSSRNHSQNAFTLQISSTRPTGMLLQRVSSYTPHPNDQIQQFTLFLSALFFKKYYLMSEISDYDLILTLVLFVLQGEFSPFEIYNCGICP